MNVLGSIQNVGQDAYVNKTTPGKAAQNKEGGGRQVEEQNAAVAITLAPASEEAVSSFKARLARMTEAVEKAASGTVAGEPKDGLLRNLIESISEAGSAVSHGRETASSSDSESASMFGEMDRTFGVEQMTYSNMWKVLKTVFREIGEIKDAISGQFFLGVSERVERADTDMEFDSIADYIERGDTLSGKTVPTEAADGEAGQIVADPEASLQAQANVVPDTALHLLGGTG